MSNKIQIELAICPQFTTAILALASALSGKVEVGSETPSNIVPFPQGDTDEAPADEAPKGRGRPKASKVVKEEPEAEEQPKGEKPKVEKKPKVDPAKRHEALCERARELIKGGVSAAQVKAIALELGADKLSVLDPTEENLDAAEAALEALAKGDDDEEDV